MKKNQIIALVHEAQEKQAEIVGLSYDATPNEVAISTLKQAIYHNRKVVDSRLKILVDSLYQCGFLGGIFINSETQEVVDGWYRMQIWEQMGHKTIPAFTIRFKSRQQECETHLRLNLVAAVFEPQEFGVEFENINVLDFGVEGAEPTLLLEQKTQYTPKKDNEPKEGYSKFYTSLPTQQYEKLKEIKAEMKYEEWSDVLELLMEFYEDNRNK